MKVLNNFFINFRKRLFEDMVNIIFQKEVYMLTSSPLWARVVWDVNSGQGNTVIVNWDLIPPSSSENHILMQERIWERLLNGQSAIPIEEVLGNFLRGMERRNIYESYLTALGEFEDMVIRKVSEEINRINLTINKLGKILGLNVQLNVQIVLPGVNFQGLNPVKSRDASYIDEIEEDLSIRKPRRGYYEEGDIPFNS